MNHRPGDSGSAIGHKFDCDSPRQMEDSQNIATLANYRYHEPSHARRRSIVVVIRGSGFPSSWRALYFAEISGFAKLRLRLKSSRKFIC